MRPYAYHGMVRVDDDDNDNDETVKLHTPLDNTLCIAYFPDVKSIYWYFSPPAPNEKARLFPAIRLGYITMLN